jgi:hypothetical protein
MRRWLPVALLLLVLPILLGCPKRKPPQPPQPPPVVTQDDTKPPAEPVGFDNALRQEGGRFVVAGQPFEVRGAIPCWPPDLPGGEPGPLRAAGREIPYMWTLTSAEWIDHAKAVGGANLFHVRLGPYRDDKLCCGMAAVGGPFLVDGSFNPRFDAYLLKLVWHALRAGVYVEVDIDDAWGFKHQCNGDDVGYALDCEPRITPARRRYYEHYVGLLKNFGNVVFLLGNEADLTPTWTPAQEREKFALVRGIEGGGHMIGSNSRDYAGPYDYFASHARGAVDSPVNGRPVWVNEYNPSLSVGEFAQCFSEMKARGGACWYWRSDGSDEVQEASLAVMKGGPVTDYGCSLNPKPDLSTLDWWIDQRSRPGTIDTTPMIRGNHDHCVNVGMSEFDRQPRFNCPLANEGDPRRVPCEQWAIKGTHPLFRSDGEVSCVDVACFRVRTTGTWLEVCDNEGQHCKRVAVD